MPEEVSRSEIARDEKPNRRFRGGRDWRLTAAYPEPTERCCARKSRLAAWCGPLSPCNRHRDNRPEGAPADRLELRVRFQNEAVCESPCLPDQLHSHGRKPCPFSRRIVRTRRGTKSHVRPPQGRFATAKAERSVPSRQGVPFNNASRANSIPMAVWLSGDSNCPL